MRIQIEGAWDYWRKFIWGQPDLTLKSTVEVQDLGGWEAQTEGCMGPGKKTESCQSRFKETKFRKLKLEIVQSFSYNMNLWNISQVLFYIGRAMGSHIIL